MVLPHSPTPKQLREKVHDFIRRTAQRSTLAPPLEDMLYAFGIELLTERIARSSPTEETSSPSTSNALIVPGSPMVWPLHLQGLREAIKGAEIHKRSLIAQVQQTAADIANLNVEKNRLEKAIDGERSIN